LVVQSLYPGTVFGLTAGSPIEVSKENSDCRREAKEKIINYSPESAKAGNLNFGS
jgi:hypothetical protein